MPDSKLPNSEPESYEISNSELLNFEPKKYIRSDAELPDFELKRHIPSDSELHNSNLPEKQNDDKKMASVFIVAGSVVAVPFILSTFAPALFFALPAIGFVGLAFNTLAESFADNYTQLPSLEPQKTISPLQPQKSKPLSDIPNAHFQSILYSTRQTPIYALLYLQKSSDYRDYFNEVISKGTAELTLNKPSAKWELENNNNYIEIEESSTVISGQTAPNALQEGRLAKELAVVFGEIKSLFSKNLKADYEKLFFDVALIGYTAFIADLFTPNLYIGASFLETYVYSIHNNNSFDKTGFYTYNKESTIHYPTKSSKVMDMFITSYQSYISILPEFKTRLQNPIAFITAYSQLFLQFTDKTDMQNSLLPSMVALTASFLPVCEKALSVHGKII